MQTLTLYIEQLYALELGAESYQTFAKKTVSKENYRGLTLSGSFFQEVLFEDVIFENCTFFGSTLDNCLFINCLFINCKFQFSKFSDCNFEATAWENCIWGLTALKDSVMVSSEAINNFAFLSEGLNTQTQTLTLSEILNLPA